MNFVLSLWLAFGPPESEPVEVPTVPGESVESVESSEASGQEGPAQPQIEVKSDDDLALEQEAEEPADFGPFWDGPAPSDVRYPGESKRLTPVLSVKDGTLCFAEDSHCKMSTLAWVDVAAGTNIVSGNSGFDVPYTQFRLGGGFVVRPLYLARKTWHPWGIGATASWSLGSGSVLKIEDEDNPGLERRANRALRIAVINQIWLTQRRFSPHIDISLGVVNGDVFKEEGIGTCFGNRCNRFWGTHAELGVGIGGWASLFLSGDFLDQDTRLVIGMRTHALAGGPVAAAVVLGLLAGGVALAGGGS